ncbi:MAG: hypothetical protein LBC83_00630 [Oscillospiraceae bacterium]|jgi:hypothetical protein|nr:hypothetical protein [Oscillospiraceae bacterium]
MAALCTALEKLRGDDPAAWEAVFACTNERVYFACKTVFADREAILRAMSAFYVTLRGGLPGAQTLQTDAACQAAVDAWIFNTCKRLLKEEDSRRFLPHSGDTVQAKAYKQAREETQPRKGSAQGGEKRWLMHLSPEQRLILLMRDGGALALEAIAEQLRVPESYVAAQLWQVSRTEGACDPGQYLREGLAGSAALNAETRQTLFAAIREGLCADTIPKRKESAPFAREEMIPTVAAGKGQVDLLHLLRVSGTLLTVVAVVAAAVLLLTRQTSDPRPSGSEATFLFEDPYRSNLDDLISSQIYTVTAAAQPSYIIVVPSGETTAPQTQRPATVPTATEATTAPLATASTQAAPAQSSAEATADSTALTDPPTTQTTARPDYSYTSNQTTRTTVLPWEDPSLAQ